MSIEVKTSKKKLCRIYEESKGKALDCAKALFGDVICKPSVGIWYKVYDAEGDKFLIQFTDSKLERVFGFFKKEPFDTWSWSYKDEVCLYFGATYEEVEKALIKEAELRGLVEGATINPLNDFIGTDVCTMTDAEWGGYDYLLGYLFYGTDNNDGSAIIFKDGKWATKVEVPTNKVDTLEDNKWYKDGEDTFFVEKWDEFPIAIGYGMCGGKWSPQVCNKVTMECKREDLELANTNEIYETLSAEATRRGFVEGAKYVPIEEGITIDYSEDKCVGDFISYTSYKTKEETLLARGYRYIFIDGLWTTLVKDKVEPKEMTIAELQAELGYEVKVVK